MTEQYTSEIGFDLGWDYARFGRVLSDERANPDVIRGYKAGLCHFTTPQRHPNRFESKWLQLRLSALRRGRIVQTEVTPEFLKRIDVAACPITLVELTHSQLQDSDWSVDRINNDGAYAEGNLVIMSTRANTAKGTKAYGEICELATGRACDERLTTREWGRLRSVMAAACQLDKVYYMPLLTAHPLSCPANSYTCLQILAAGVVREARARNAVVKYLNRFQPRSSQQQRLSLAFERLALLMKNATYAYDAFSDDGVQKMLSRIAV
ncbi:hypothetical protein [Caballeronia telluris]|uniref:Uncharacterized protein n=1 Tax=Caballeronia telluris TaxID=326475 RepID=A0A158KDH6_9BURK|nr:hypothetical protein [Caballeronia telluris]SAL78590.1 hypothetical protein AWB66_05873 [Caballeronia telluris]